MTWKKEWMLTGKQIVMVYITSNRRSTMSFFTWLRPRSLSMTSVRKSTEETLKAFALQQHAWISPNRWSRLWLRTTVWLIHARTSVLTRARDGGRLIISPVEMIVSCTTLHTTFAPSLHELWYPTIELLVMIVLFLIPTMLPASSGSQFCHASSNTLVLQTSICFLLWQTSMTAFCETFWMASSQTKPNTLT